MIKRDLIDLATKDLVLFRKYKCDGVTMYFKARLAKGGIAGQIRTTGKKYYDTLSRRC